MRLLLWPDDRPMSRSGDDISLGISDMPKAMHAIRCAWSDHRDIACIPAISVVAQPGVSTEDRAHVEDRLANILFDLGNSALDAWWGARNAINNSAQASCEPKQDALIGLGKGRPVVCVASGPTTADHIPDIRSAQHNGAIIICADSIFKKLVSSGIEPDIVTVLERPPLFAELVPPDICDRTILVCPPVVDPLTAHGWNGRRVWFWQETAGLYRWLGPDVPTAFSGRSAGTLAVAVALHLQPTTTFLVGHDLCRVDFLSHSDGVGAFTVLGQAKGEAESPPCGIHAPIDTVCRDNQTRPSTRFWHLCRQDIEAMLVGSSSVVGIDLRGASISGCQWMPRIPVGSGSPFGPLRPACISPSRYRSNLKEQILADIDRFRSLLKECAACTEQASMVAAMRSLQPRGWANRETEELHAYVLSSIYAASTLRMHIRRDDPECVHVGMRVLTRGIMPILRRMERDLC